MNNVTLEFLLMLFQVQSQSTTEAALETLVSPTIQVEQSASEIKKFKDNYGRTYTIAKLDANRIDFSESINIDDPNYGRVYIKHTAYLDSTLSWLEHYHARVFIQPKDEKSLNLVHETNEFYRKDGTRNPYVSNPSRFDLSLDQRIALRKGWHTTSYVKASLERYEGNIDPSKTYFDLSLRKDGKNPLQNYFNKIVEVIKQHSTRKYKMELQK